MSTLARHNSNDYMLDSGSLRPFDETLDKSQQVDFLYSDHLSAHPKGGPMTAQEDKTNIMAPSTTPPSPTLLETQDTADPQIPIFIGKTTQIDTLPTSAFHRFTRFTNNPPSQFNLHPQTSPTAAQHVLTWLHARLPHDDNIPMPLPGPAEGTSITLEEALHQHSVCHQLRLLPGNPKIGDHKRGDEVRDEIWLYLWDKNRTLTTEEFAMVLDLVACDLGLVKLALQSVRKRYGLLAEELQTLGDLMRRADEIVRQGKNGLENAG